MTAEAEPRAIVVAPERYGLPRVASAKVRCSRCDASCWISLRAELGPDDVAICVVCAMAVIKPTDTIVAAPWVPADLAELLADELTPDGGPLLPRAGARRRHD